MNFFKRRAFRQGSFAVAITIIGVVLLIVLYIVLSTLSSRLNWRLDLTPNRMFELTQESIDFLDTLEKDVNIFVLNSEDDFVNAAQPFTFQANEVIRMYDFFSPRVTLQYVDILRNPTFVAEFSELNLRPNQIIVESPDTGRHRVIEFRDLFNIVTGQGGQTNVRSSRAEQVMTSAILNVTTVNQVRVTVLSGYNQAEIPAFLRLLEMNNYEIVHENLVTTPYLDPEAEIALLVAPARDISEDDLRKLDNFLLNDYQYGRTLFFITGAEQTPMSQMPNLSAWLAEWGIAVKDSVVFEMDFSLRFAFDDPFIGFANYSRNERANTLSQHVRANDLFVASFYASPISILFDERGGRDVVPLLETSSSSGILPETGVVSEDNLTGPHPVLTLSTSLRFQGPVRLNSQVLVSTSLTSFSPSVLGEVNFGNSQFYLDILNDFTDREDTVRIQDKSFSIATIQMTLAQARLLLVATVILLPIGMLASGIIIWLRRRHR